MKLSRLCVFGLVLFATVGCDQATKTLARDVLPVTGALSYFGSHLRLQYAENPGAFLNFGAGLSEAARFWLFGVSVNVFLLALAFAVLRTRDPWRRLGLTLILAGGVGNLIDRYLFGHVTDFLILSAGPLHTGIFNVADMAIVLGVLLIGIPPSAPKVNQKG